MIRRFVKYYKPYKGLFMMDLVCALLVAGVDLVYPLMSNYALKTLIPNDQVAAFVWLMAILLTAYLLRGFLQFVIAYWGHLLGVYMETDMRRELFGHLQKLSFRFYDKHRTGELMSRVVSDLFEVVELAHHGPEDLFISCITLAGSIIVMFTLQWKLALVITLLVPLLVVFTIWRRKRMGASSRKVKEKVAVINSNIESSISGVRTAKAFTNEGYEMEKFVDGCMQHRQARRGFYKQMGVFHAGTEVITNIINLSVIAVGGVLIFSKSLELVDLLTFTMYVSSFLGPVRKLAFFAEQYTTGMAGFIRFQELMAVEPDITDAPDAQPLICRGGHIEIEDVTFSYNEEVQVLEHVNLTIPAGKTLALVGPSGGGKTTLCHLIPRFYETEAGRITIDGQDIREVTLRSLREQVGIVQQDVMIFAGTVMDNIRYGRLDATDEEVMEAAKKAEIHDAIMEMPDGYNTYVGERGIMLSGGQKQRVSIARIFLKNPPILLLDEATSALDTVTEAHIQAALEKLSQGRTTLVIAHRLSTIRNADLIAYIDTEGVREIGTHQELLDKGGYYAKLHAATQAIQ
ncbi:MAG: ABC transporter ATP-binding protein [Ruminococcaceae bacterium]|nr:ABC transporter ATP-binding protein [Oscillospiraceae bacterium]